MLKKIKSVDGVVTALGGRRAVATMFECHPEAIDHWLINEIIPSHAYPVVITALQRVGKTAGFELFRWGRGSKAKKRAA